LPQENKIKNWGPGLTANDLGDTVAANNVCFTWKTRTQQNLTLKRVTAA
jgi:riboflavin synthase alpha subunit